MQTLGANVSFWGFLRSSLVVLVSSIYIYMQTDQCFKNERYELDAYNP